jgi:hypothetical protein
MLTFVNEYSFQKSSQKKLGKNKERASNCHVAFISDPLVAINFNFFNVRKGRKNIRLRVDLVDPQLAKRGFQRNHGKSLKVTKEFSQKIIEFKIAKKQKRNFQKHVTQPHAEKLLEAFDDYFLIFFAESLQKVGLEENIFLGCLLIIKFFLCYSIQ